MLNLLNMLVQSSKLSVYWRETTTNEAAAMAFITGFGPDLVKRARVE